MYKVTFFNGDSVVSVFFMNLDEACVFVSRKASAIDSEHFVKISFVEV